MARIILSGTMIREPRGGSNLWYLAWLVGFKMNGHEVYFVEKSEWPDDCYDTEGIAFAFFASELFS